MDPTCSLADANSFPPRLRPYLTDRVSGERPPQRGIWQAGSVVHARLNSSAARDGVIGWRCVEGGKPGRWATWRDTSAAPPPPTTTCSTELDCSLNGECRAGVCVCHGPWAGESCGELLVLPIEPVQGYGVSPNVSAWGGSAVRHGGRWHLYVTEIIGGCLLEEYATNSQCSHAVSDTPEGPFKFVDSGVGAWCTNPQVVLQPQGRPLLALFHIGNGSWNGGGPPQPCHHGHQAGSDLPVATHLGNASGSTLHIADSPAGPWRPAPPPPPCSNPAPFLHSNGTWFLFCDGPFMWRASSVRGPWAPVEMHFPPMNCVGDCAGVQGAYEDPVLFIDTRARWVSTTACKRPASLGCVSHTGGAVAAHPVACL